MSNTPIDVHANEVFDLDIGASNYTVKVYGHAGNADGSDVLISIHDSREDAAIARQLPRVPDLDAEPQLLGDLIAGIVPAVDLDLDADASLPVIPAGTHVRSARPGYLFLDAHGNVLELTYRQDSSDHYAPSLRLVSLDSGFVKRIFVRFLVSSNEALIAANTRASAQGTHLRNAKAEAAKQDRDSKLREAAARDLVESLSTSRNYHAARAALLARKSEILQRALTQYASEEAWVVEDGGPRNRLTSNIDGFSVAKVALSDVTVEDDA